MNAHEAILTPETLIEWAATTHGLIITHENACQFIYARRETRPWRGRTRVLEPRVFDLLRYSEYNLALILKFELLPYSHGTPPRPTADPNRIFYPLDDYNRVTYRVRTPTPSEYPKADNELSPLAKTAYRRLEDLGGYIGIINS